jgi:dTDP-4-dehydrorhamnose 3,5-epimerase
MTVTPTDIAGVFVVERPIHGDERGFLSRLFCADTLRAAGWTKPVVQVNHTFTAKAGGVRGMHFQHPPHAEMKLVSCLSGEVWDVAVDLRRGSPTFLRWHAEPLSADNRRALLIPEGCAHGFQALVDGCELIYCHSAAYVPDAEGGVTHDDPMLGIRWPLPVVDLSLRDANHSPLSTEFSGLSVMRSEGPPAA